MGFRPISRSPLAFPLLPRASKDASILGLASYGGSYLLILLGLILLLSAVPAHAESKVDQVFGKLDLAFERNEGQIDPKVKFFSRGEGYGLFLTPDEAVLRL